MVFHDLLVLLQVVVVNVPVHKEVLNLKCVHFLLVFQQLYRQDVFFLGDQACWVALLENAHLGQEDLDLAVEFVNEEELV